MTIHKAAPQDPLWLYVSYKGAMDKDCPTPGQVAFGLELYRFLYSVDEPQKFNIVDFEGRHFTGFSKEIQQLILCFYHEGIALSHLLGSQAAVERMSPQRRQELEVNGIPIDDSLKFQSKIFGSQKTFAQEEFEKIAGKMHAIKALEYIREQAALVYLRDSGQITNAEFDEGVGMTSARMDKEGLNGIVRMIAARAEIEEAIANDPRPMVITPSHIKDMPSFGSVSEIPEYAARLYLAQNQKDGMPRGEYYTLMRDNVYTTPFQKNNLLLSMCGKDYPEAYNKRVTMLWENELHATGEPLLNATLERLEGKVMGEASIEEKIEAVRAMMISYGLGATHEVVQGWQKQNVNNKNNSSKKNELPALNNGAGNESDSEIETNGQPDNLKNKQNKSPQSTSPALSGGSRTPSSESSDEKKHKNFVTAGKIATTAVVGIGLVDGIRNILKLSGDGNLDKPKDNSSQIFLRAIEIAAAVAGIVLVWKSKKVHNFLNVLFKGSAHSV